jgi:histone deacetylase complex regulatory component SIN3
MDSLQVVLQGHPDLIRGFNDFLPRGNGLKEKQGGDDDA